MLGYGRGGVGRGGGGEGRLLRLLGGSRGGVGRGEGEGGGEGLKLLGADVNITGQQKTGHLLMGEGKKK